jgi:glycosyltransferase involved in cell wall biosynthesis
MQANEEFRCGGKRLGGVLAQGTADLPLVTVITSILNGQPYVAGCLESVLNQDYPNIEHIVLDGVSNDGTVDVLRQFSDRIALWRSEPDRGCVDAWNKGLAEARGEWICFLGVDDEFLPGAVSAYMACAASHPRAEFLSSTARLVFASGKEIIIGSPWNWSQFSRRMTVCHVGSMHRRSLFDRLGLYDVSYPLAADYEFLLRSRAELRSAFLPVETVLMRAGGLSCSLKAVLEARRAKCSTGGLPKALALWEVRREIIRIGPGYLARQLLGLEK